jgi:TP901 family phage tail tape measure protein
MSEEVGALRVSLSIDTAEFTQRVSDINSRLRAIRSEFNAAGDGTRAFANSMDGMRAKQELLTRQLELQRQKVQSLRQRYLEVAAAEGENSRAAVSLLTQYNNQIGVMNRMESSLNSTQQALDHLRQEAERNATVWGRMQNRFSEVGDRLSTVGGKMKSAGSEIAKSFGTAFLAVGGGLGVAAKSAMDFESQMSSVKSVMAPDEVKQFGGELEKLAITMGAKTKYSATEAAKGIEELVKAGVNVKDIINGGLDGALSLATAGELELGDAASIASTALNAFKDDNISVSKAADILAGAANASATDVGELKFGLSAVAAVASGVGLSFKDTSTTLAAFAQNGLKGQDAGTSLKTMLLNLTPTTKAQTAEFDALNLGTSNAAAGYKYLIEHGIKPMSSTVDDVNNELHKLAERQAGAHASAGKIADAYGKLAKQSGFASSAFYDQNGKLKSMSQIAGILQKALSGLNNEQRQTALKTMFGTDAIRAGNILYKEGAKGINGMTKAMDKVKAADVAKEKLNNVKGAIEKLKGDP